MAQSVYGLCCKKKGSWALWLRWRPVDSNPLGLRWSWPPGRGRAEGSQPESGENGGHSSPDLIAARLARRRRFPPPTSPTEALPLSAPTPHSPPLTLLLLLSSNPSPWTTPRLHHAVHRRRSSSPGPPRPPHARHRDQLRRHCRCCGTSAFSSSILLSILPAAEASSFWAELPLSAVLALIGCR